MTTAATALEAYLPATNTHDFDQIETALAPDAVYFFGDANWVGLADIRGTCRTQHAAVAVYTYHWWGTINGVQRSGAGRATNVFAHTGHGWHLTHEHLSPLPPARTVQPGTEAGE